MFAQCCDGKGEPGTSENIAVRAHFHVLASFNCLFAFFVALVFLVVCRIALDFSGAKERIVKAGFAGSRRDLPTEASEGPKKRGPVTGPLVTN